ncbi:MAG TPA: alpha/beta hydrolase-fold protein [Bacteroidales bacterium]|jgi:enterochelin esterase family protein|nr:esterase [Bacteroidales bacterium]HNV66135.1 alpha/beta hydrolase-fold protein [Bacteroidales bacterium]HOC04311.1 alpha/beta hydrolase-fold protein [Bacteroidales bacterium]HPH74785.1 alpha/beta hydrolase-fold protein [Bacteroidales bacterium]HPO40581.1 alpha/beta hydrolase-fold protein [Bacteroidales bacterium]
MKNRVLFSLVCLFIIAGIFAQEVPNFRRAPVKSPEIGEKTITFRILAPQANLVRLYGSWMKSFDSSLDMEKDTAGTWILTIPMLPAELYTYNFIVDGLSVNDANNVFLQRDGTRYLSVLLVPGELSANYFEAGQRGNLLKVWYDSPTLGMTRRMYVYTPYGYETGTQSYPVLYLLHGGGGDEDAWVTMGRACQILDNLIEKKLALPMICVMPNGNPSQQAARTTMLPEKALDRSIPGFANLYINSIVKDIIPYVEKNFRVIASPDARAVSGLSMGGGHTLSVTNEYPGLFGYICPLSMGIRDTQTDIDSKLQAVKNAGYKLYWVGCGTEDFVYEMAKSLDVALTRNELNHTFYVTGGGHTWSNWRIYLNTFAQLLFK